MSGTWWLCAMVLVGAALLASPARAAEYYVSPDGNDANSGTSSQKAFKTIARAAQAASAGDVVHVAPGKYTGSVRPARSGEKGRPITFERHGGGEVIVTTTKNEYCFDLRDRNHITIDGFTMKDAYAWVYMDNAHHNTVKNCEFDGARTFHCLKINSSSYNRVLNCVFKKARPWSSEKREGMNWIPAAQADYIDIWRDSHYNLVDGCEFNEIGHAAIMIWSREPKYMASHNIVRNCVFRNPRWKCIDIGQAEHTLFENNTFTGLAADLLQLETSRLIMRRCFFYGYRDSTNGQPDIRMRAAIRMQTVDPGEHGVHNLARHGRFYNNLFYDNQQTLSNNSFRGTVTDNVFKNNIFSNNGQTIFLGFPDYRSRNRNYFANNVIRGNAAGEKVIKLAGDVFLLPDAQATLPDLYKGNIEADPQLMDPAKNDFRLKRGSPCIDTGAALTFTLEAGKGTEVVVDDALYFCDGYGLIEGDEVVVGSNAPARILEVDYDKGVLKLDREIAWQKGDPVNLPYEGAGPDIGPCEFDARGPKIGRLSGR